MSDRLDGTCTRMLVAIFGGLWKQHKQESLEKTVRCDEITTDQKTVIYWAYLDEDRKTVK